MISIIIPVWNSAKTLANCLDSLLAQTCKNHEIIIVDDGSSDNSLDIASQYEKKFKTRNIDLIVIKHQKNQGAPSARNTGFRTSKGDCLIFCDSDIVLDKEALSNLLNTLIHHPVASYVYSSFLWGRKLFKIGEFNSEKLKQGPCIHTSALIKREHFPSSGWDESIKKFQDWDLWLTMLEEGHTGVWLDQVLFKVKPGGTMSGWLPSFAYKLFPFLPSVKKYKKALAIIKQKHDL